MDVKEIVAEIKEQMTPLGGIRNIYFIGCGGSMASMYSAFYLMKNEAKSMGTNIFTSNEFVYSTPKALSNQTVCVLCSKTGTPETVEAVKLANEKGAITIALTGADDTPMAEAGKFVLTYTHRSKGNQATAMKVGFEILHQFEGYENYDAAMKAYDKIDDIVANALEKSLPDAQKFAQEFKDDEIFYILGSGSAYPAAYTMANCQLMEMQWKHAVVVHSGEYFHGPFETTDKKLPIVLLKANGRTRFLDERVEKFINQYAERVYILDANELGLETLDPSIAEYFNSVLFLTVAYFYVNEMSKVTDHPMSTRRYMWQFEYQIKLN